jgi:hypothetical protein
MMLKNSFQNLHGKSNNLEQFLNLKVDTSSKNSEKGFYSPTSIATHRSSDGTSSRGGDEVLSCASGAVSECGDSVFFPVTGELDTPFEDCRTSKVFLPQWRPKSPSDELVRTPQQILRRKYQAQYLNENGFTKI